MKMKAFSSSTMDYFIWDLKSWHSDKET